MKKISNSDRDSYDQRSMRISIKLRVRNGWREVSPEKKIKNDHVKYGRTRNCACIRFLQACTSSSHLRQLHFDTLQASNCWQKYFIAIVNHVTTTTVCVRVFTWLINYQHSLLCVPAITTGATTSPRSFDSIPI